MADANSAAQVLVGKPKVTGGIRFAPLGTAMPTDAKSELNAKFENAGYVSEDGLVETIDASDDKIKAWGGDIVKIVRTEHSVSYTFTLIESASATALKLLFGEENVTVTAATSTKGRQIVVKKTAAMTPRRAFVFDMADLPAAIRVAIEDGQPSISGDVNFTDGDAIAYEVTVEAFPNAQGVKSTLMIDDGVTTTAA